MNICGHDNNIDLCKKLMNLFPGLLGEMFIRNGDTKIAKMAYRKEPMLSTETDISTSIYNIESQGSDPLSKINWILSRDIAITTDYTRYVVGRFLSKNKSPGKISQYFDIQEDFNIIYLMFRTGVVNGNVNVARTYGDILSKESNNSLVILSASDVSEAFLFGGNDMISVIKKIVDKSIIDKGAALMAMYDTEIIEKTIGSYEFDELQTILFVAIESGNIDTVIYVYDNFSKDHVDLETSIEYAVYLDSSEEIISYLRSVKG